MKPAIKKIFPRRVKETPHLWITMADGVRLAARLWLPTDAARNPVPALLEYLPYRKRDGTHERDVLNHPYLAGHGYGCLRVDIRGTGDSEGLLTDEYAEQEQNDAVEIVSWLSKQKWCTGRVGMFGLSWGGFNALQVAERQPEALKAIVTICSTDDRYEDDIHYKGGTMLSDNFGWAAAMLAYQSLPPDPETVGPTWRKRWLERLKAQPFMITEWLKHPHRDTYWKQGSVCEDFSRITAATLVVGGWHDAYVNAVPRLMRGLRCPRKAIIGPWAHHYPHLATPEPRIGFLQEMLRWWDFYLKDINTHVNDDPDYRIFIMDGYKPGQGTGTIAGRWVAENYWGFGNIETKSWPLTAAGIAAAPGEEQALTVASVQTTGAASGRYLSHGAADDMPGDQTQDDAQSLCFDSPLLTADLDVVGQASVDLEFASDQPVANVAIRLNDVWPDGSVSRITYQLQNLCLQLSRDAPDALVPGKRYRVKIKLNDSAWRISAGHRLRVAISTACFPMMWPAPEPVTLTVYTGKSMLNLPVRKPPHTGKDFVFAAVETAKPAIVDILEVGSLKSEKSVDANTGGVQSHAAR